MSGVLAIIQARMESSRLPGKSMMPLAGVPLIEHVIKRVQAATSISKVVVATTDHRADDVLAAHVEALGVDVYRGSSEDVLGRFFWCAERYPDYEIVVRITADDWAKDPALIDYAVAGFSAGWADPLPDGRTPHYLHLGGITWALGADVEVFSRTALETAYRSATDHYDREHVTPSMELYFGKWVLKDDQRRATSATRLTIDTPEDYDLASRVYDALYPTSPLFGYDEALAALVNV